MCRYIIAGVLVLFYLEHFVEASPVFSPVRMPRSCAKYNKTYCTEKDSDYPEKIIENLVKDFGNIWQEVRQDPIPSKRSGFHGNPCSYTNTFKPIHLMIDENDRLRYVVQSGKRFNQIFYIEECVKPGPITNDTNTLSELQLEGKALECQQKYMNFKLLVLSLDGTKLEAVNMKNGIPVCCSCIWNKHKDK